MIRSSSAATSTPSPPTSATDAVPIGEVIGTLSPPGVTLIAARALLRPRPVARELTALAAASTRILRGTDDHLPSPKDRRFADAAWLTNPLYHRVAQEYHAVCAAVDHLVDGLDDSGLDWHDMEQARFAAMVLKSAMAPTNTLAGNPHRDQARVRHRWP